MSVTIVGRLDPRADAWRRLPLHRGSSSQSLRQHGEGWEMNVTIGRSASSATRSARRSGPSRRRRTSVVVGFFGALVLVATPAAASRPAGAVILDPVTLSVWPSGQGKIEATPEGGSTVTCDYTDILSTTNPCPVTLERGSSVTVKAT